MFAGSEIELQELYKVFDKPEATLTVGTDKHRLVFSVQHRLSMDEWQSLIDNVCNAVLNPDIGAFYPEMKDYCIRVETIKHYTNLRVRDESQWWNVVYGTPIFAMITGSDKHPAVFDGREYDDNLVIDTEQYERVLEAIDQKIAYYLAKLPNFTV